MSQTRYGSGVRATALRGHGAKLQHLAAIRRSRAAMPVTGLTIHDIVISPRFPKLYFFSNAF
jgi:hypothetical protein